MLQPSDILMSCMSSAMLVEVKLVVEEGWSWVWKLSVVVYHQLADAAHLA